ncbi:MAG TPA: DUF72 domain-containing protein [Campylobacteraceae bacterium]|nr:DUF72 domain-containing protein [Campylobacteraceae bacterium]
MQDLTSKIHIGTSGFYYAHWKGVFYPDTLAKAHFFTYYMEHFETVELNSTFYHLPRAKTVEHWMEESPETFLFALKAHRQITHYHKLKDAGEPLYRFLHLIKPLKPKIAAILFQLPPSLHMDAEILAAFLALLPPGYRFAVEFRHESWYCDAVYEVLKAYNVALCLNDFAQREITPLITADFSYMRLHGPTGRYGGSYDDATLAHFCDMLLEMAHHQKALFVYFNNDTEGYAVENARRLRALVEHR